MLVLPRNFVVGQLDVLLNNLETILGRAKRGTVEIDFDKLNFIDPAGAVTLANVADYLRSIGYLPKAKTPLPANPAVSYLVDVRFFELLADPTKTELAPGRDTTFPLSRIAHTQTFDLLKNKFMPWLGNRLAISEASLEQLRACLGELFNNIADHADVTTGFFFAQHFPNLNRVRISLADFGIGIPRRVRSKLPELDDGAALAKAFEEGFSTKTTPRNRGAGLDWLKRYVVETNGGAVLVLSHYGRLRAKPSRSGVAFSPTLGAASFPGVLYYISLRTDTIEPVEETRGELEW